jgi:hypothetical protein
MTKCSRAKKARWRLRAAHNAERLSGANVVSIRNDEIGVLKASL